MRMLRRAYLKSVLGTVAVAGAALHGLFGTARAAQPAGSPGARRAPATVAEALSTRATDPAVAFILQQPKAAARASTADQAALLRLVAADKAKCDRSRADHERAALTVLQPAAGDAASLASIARGFGGARSIQPLLPGIQSKELKAILVKAVDLTR